MAKTSRYIFDFNSISFNSHFVLRSILISFVQAYSLLPHFPSSPSLS